jgi:5-formyltetrahydrofolate cyclo-ligase
MDQSEIVVHKQALRQEAIATRDALADRAQRSAQICGRVVALDAFVAAGAIHCFLPIGAEVDTRPIVAAALAAGKAVAYPVTVRGGPLVHSWIDSLAPEAFEPGVFGTLRPRVMRPATPGEWQLTVVPLLAFDRAGYRLGYGKGHYDQLLAQGAGLAVGVAFAAQERPQLPRAPHDQPLDLILTEDEIITPAR